MKKLITGIIFTMLYSSIYAQVSENFEGTYETSGFSITLVRYMENRVYKYDGEITYNSKKIAFKGGAAGVVQRADYCLLYIRSDKGGGFFGDKSQSAKLQLYSNGNLLWTNNSFSGMPNEQLLNRSKSHSATQSSQNTQQARSSQSQTQVQAQAQSQTVIVNIGTQNTDNGANTQPKPRLTSVQSNSGSWSVYNSSGNYVTSGRAYNVLGDDNWYNVQSNSGNWSIYDCNGKYITSGYAEKAPGQFYNVRSNSGNWSVYNSNGTYHTSGRMQ